MRKYKSQHAKATRTQNTDDSTLSKPSNRYINKAWQDRMVQKETLIDMDSNSMGTTDIISSLQVP